MFAVAFEITMDKGNDLDWLSSEFICKLTLIWLIGLVGFIISQIKGKETLVRLNVLSNWHYAIGTISLTVMNAILLGSLAMIPQFMQTMMGYDTFTSGLSMMPRGIRCLIGLLLCQQLQMKMDVRVLASFGVLLLSIGSWILGDINLQISQTSIYIPIFFVSHRTHTLALKTTNLNTTSELWQQLLTYLRNQRLLVC